MAAIPPLKVQILSDDPTGVYRAFPQSNGHTLVGRLVEDWQQLPDQANIVVITTEEEYLHGKHNLPNFRAWGEFLLSQADGGTRTVYVEFVSAVYEPVAFVAGEAFVVQPVLA